MFCNVESRRNANEHMMFMFLRGKPVIGESRYF